jgi:MFS family permease
MAVSVPLVLLVIRTRPSEMNLLPDGQPPSDAAEEPLSGHTLSQAIRTFSFWFIAANMLLTTGMANAIGVHCIPYLSDIGHSELFAATAYGMSMFFMTVGKVASGFCADRWGARQTFVFSAIVTATGIVILLFAAPVWVVLLFVFVYGLPQGGPLTLTPLVTADCHGLRSFGAIFGLATLFSIFGAAVAPVVVGYMYDSSGSYRLAFILLIGMTLAGAYCIHRAKPKEKSAVEPLRGAELDKADAA